MLSKLYRELNQNCSNNILTSVGCSGMSVPQLTDKKSARLKTTSVKCHDNELPPLQVLFMWPRKWWKCTKYLEGRHTEKEKTKIFLLFPIRVDLYWHLTRKAKTFWKCILQPVTFCNPDYKRRTIIIHSPVCLIRGHIKMSHYVGNSQRRGAGYTCQTMHQYTAIGLSYFIWKTNR